MRKLSAFLVALALTIGFALPASATNSYETAILGTTGNCAVDLRITNSNSGGNPASGSGYISPRAGADYCTYMGLKTQILTCAGTISTSAEQGTFNPRNANYLQNVYRFGCSYAHVTGIYVRIAADNGDWSPDTGYVFYSFVDNCQPAICIL